MHGVGSQPPPAPQRSPAGQEPVVQRGTQLRTRSSAGQHRAMRGTLHTGCETEAQSPSMAHSLSQRPGIPQPRGAPGGKQLVPLLQSLSLRQPLPPPSPGLHAVSQRVANKTTETLRIPPV